MESHQHEILTKCGLTKNESKVYLALLTLGSATAVEVTRQSKVHRVNVYDVLERLIEKGLISTVIQSNKKIYEAASPSQLTELLREKEVLLNQIMPELSEEYKSKKDKQQVHHFFGPEGVMRAYKMMLEQNETVYALGGSGLNRKYMKHRHEMWDRERIRRGMACKALYYEFVRKDKKKIWDDSTVKIKFIPDKFRTTGMVDICGDLVINLLPIEGSIMAIVIENKTLADTYRQFFDFMWENAKK